MRNQLMALALLASATSATAVTRTINFTTGDHYFVTSLATTYTITATGARGGSTVISTNIGSPAYNYGGGSAMIGGDFALGAQQGLYLVVGDVGSFGANSDPYSNLYGGAGGGGASSVYTNANGFLLVAGGGGGAGNAVYGEGGDAQLGGAGGTTGLSPIAIGGAGGAAGNPGGAGGGGGGGSGINSDGHDGGTYGGHGGANEFGGAGSIGSPPKGNYPGGSAGGAGGLGGGGGGGAYGEGGGGGGYSGGAGGDYVTSNYIYNGRGGGGGGSFNASLAPIAGSISYAFPGAITISFDDGTIAPPPPAGAVPEPASWAMMVAGFGLVGGMARRRGRVVLA